MSECKHGNPLLACPICDGIRIQRLERTLAAKEKELGEARQRGELQETKLHNECQAHERTKRKLARWHRAFADILADKEINQFDVATKEAEKGER